jgi:hypothetical protein
MNDAKQAFVVGPMISAGTNTVANETAGEFWIQQVNYALSAFKSAPNLNNLNQLEFDTVQLVNSAILSDIFDGELNAYLSQVPGNSVTFLQQIGLNLSQSALQAEANRLMQAAHTALGDFFQAAATLFGGGQASLPTIPPATSPPVTPTGGGYGATYSDAPGSASASGPNITETAFVTASAGNSAPIAVQIEYVANDGTGPYYANQPIAPGTSATVSLTVMPCPAGVTGTWTVTIDGKVDHTATTVFTP